MIHRYWHGPASKLSSWTGRLVWSTNRGVQLREWTDETLPGDVVRWLDAHAHAVRDVDRARHRANMVRLWALHEHGGWWVDHDVVLLGRLDALPYPMAAAHGALCNCVLGLPAGHAMLRRALDALDSSARGGRSIDVSGERLLARLRTIDVTLVELPVDPIGNRTSAQPWAVHLYAARTMTPR